MFERIGLLALLASVTLPAQEGPVPLSTWRLHAPKAVKLTDGVHFRWVVAPDNSLLLSFGQPNGKWTIQRLTGWETRRPTVQTTTFPYNFPGCAYPHCGQPVLAKDGQFFVVPLGYRPIPDATGYHRGEALMVVLDLPDLRVVRTLISDRDLAFTDLLMEEGGVLILETFRVATLPYQATAVTLPNLEPIAKCDYAIRIPNSGRGPGTEIAKTADNCSGFLAAAHLSNIQELALSPGDSRFSGLAGPECDQELMNRENTRALYRCGKEYFGDPYGDFGITFWHALKVLSVPDGKPLLSVPLHFYDSTSSGLFAHGNEGEYLLVRHGLKIEAYRLP